MSKTSKKCNENPVISIYDLDLIKILRGSKVWLNSMNLTLSSVTSIFENFLEKYEIITF